MVLRLPSDDASKVLGQDVPAINADVEAALCLFQFHGEVVLTFSLQEERILQRVAIS